MEANLNWHHHSIQNQVRRVLRKYWKQSIIKTSSSSIPTTSHYQPGGTFTLIGNNWTGGATPYTDQSGIGRWTECRITGRKNRQICFFTVYRVTSTTIQSTGPNTAYFQQWHIIRHTQQARPNPRAQVPVSYTHLTLPTIA